MELTVKVSREGALMSREAAKIAGKMSEYKSRVLIKRGDITVNAKSLIGLLSLGIAEGMALTIMATGEDEAKAAVALSSLLGA